MTEWKTYRLGDVISIKSGFAYKGEYLGKGDKYLLGMGCVSFNEKFLPSGARLYAGDVPSRYFVKAGDIVLATRQQSDNLPILGMPAIIPSTYKNTFVGANLYAIQNDSDIDNNYLYWLLRTPEYIQHIKSCQTGTTVRMITKSNIESFEFKCPNRIERNRISNLLWSLENKIENNRRINANLELQAQALFNEWLSKATTTKGTFNNIIDATLAGDWGQEVMQGNYTHEVYCIRGADIPALQNGDKGKMPIRYILEKNYITKQLRANDLVIEISGGSPTQSTGRICMVTQALLDRLGKDVVCTNFCRAITPKNGYAIYIYLYWQMLYNKNTMFSYENGTTGIKNFNISDFINKEEIEIPTAMDMKNLNGILQPIYNQIYANSLQNETLATLRDTLLPKLMNGEIKV